MSVGNITHSVWTIKREKNEHSSWSKATCYISNNFTFFQELKQNKFTPNNTWIMGPHTNYVHVYLHQNVQI